jgi:hypothetical protein
MNLMFWKKKAPVIADAKTAGHKLDLNQVSDSVTATSRHPKLSDPDTPAKLGLAARLRLGLSAFMQRFKKAPEFRAEEGETGRTAAPDETETVKPAGFIQRLVTRIRKLFSRSKPAAPEAKPAKATKPAKPSKSKKWLLIGGAIILLAGIAGAVLYLTQPEVHTVTRHDAARTTPAPDKHETPHEPEKPATDTHAAPKAEPAPETHAPPKVEPVPEKPVQPKAEPVPDKHQAEADALKNSEIETLKKQNAELQAKIEKQNIELQTKIEKQNVELQTKAESLKNTHEQSSAIRIENSAQPTGKSKTHVGVKAEVTVGNSTSKSSAMTLKEAIEAMNNNTGDFKKKP